MWRIDRLGRSLIDVLNTVNLLRERGVKVRSISDGIDPQTSSGRMMLGMLATLAEYERELITERVNAGIAAARQNGTKFGRPAVNPSVVEEKLAIQGGSCEGSHGGGRGPVGGVVASDLIPSPARSRGVDPGN